MKLISENNTLYYVKKRKYYKYQYSSWTQPALTSNTSYGTVTCSSSFDSGYLPYKAVDGDTGTIWASANNTTSAWLNWELPVTLKIASITINANDSISGGMGLVRIWTDDTKTTQIGEDHTFTGSSQVYTFTPSTPIVTSNIYIEVASRWTGTYAGNIKEITVTATQRTAQESTSSDYDYYVDVPCGVDLENTNVS